MPVQVPTACFERALTGLRAFQPLGVRAASLQIDGGAPCLDKRCEFGEKLPVLRRSRFGARHKYGKGPVGLCVEFHKRDPDVSQEWLQRTARVEYGDRSWTVLPGSETRSLHSR
jgi:hypothetical protein